MEAWFSLTKLYWNEFLKFISFLEENEKIEIKINKMSKMMKINEKIE